MAGLLGLCPIHRGGREKGVGSDLMALCAWTEMRRDPGLSIGARMHTTNFFFPSPLHPRLTCALFVQSWVGNGGQASVLRPRSTTSRVSVPRLLFSGLDMSGTSKVATSKSAPPSAAGSSSSTPTDPRADVVLVSLDKVRFPVRSAFLAQSTVFDDMLVVGEGSKEVLVQESSHDLRALLKFMVKGSEIPSMGFQEIKHTLVLADKSVPP